MEDSFFTPVEQRIKSPVEGLLLGLVLSVTAPDDKAAAVAISTCSDLIAAFKISDDVVDSCKLLAERLIREHRASFFIKSKSTRFISYKRFDSAKARADYLKRAPSFAEVSCEAAMPFLWSCIQK
jgi:hypothetical protein